MSNPQIRIARGDATVTLELTGLQWKRLLLELCKLLEPAEEEGMGMENDLPVLSCLYEAMKQYD